MPHCRYDIKKKLVLPGRANPRYEDLSYKEEKRGYRVIGGDKGDLHFEGFTLSKKNTTVHKPVLITGRCDLTKSEANDIAEQILMESFESIGLETVEHS